VRRIAELFMRPMALFAIMAIPLVFSINQLFAWTHPETASKPAAAEHAAAPHEGSPIEEARGIAAREPVALRDMPLVNARKMEQAEERVETAIVEHKHAYLNKYFFLGRLIAYLVIWSLIAQYYFRLSTDQDKTKALENTATAQRFAPLGLVLFAPTLTFFAFDWLLSLNSTWYSTIFGVYIFAQCALFQMATLILTALMLRRSGLLRDAVNVEHFHDMGKLLFGWIVFWSYIAFAQFFLTWYSNIPDELIWFHRRWRDNGGTWKTWSMALIVMHFFVPFWFLMSRNIKRRLPLLATGAVCMFVMHIADIYWVIMPEYGPLAPNFVDVACLLGVFGVYLSAVLRGMEDYALIPVGDPRLERALEFENA
jgi:hypothetical protein